MAKSKKSKQTSKRKNVYHITQATRGYFLSSKNVYRTWDEYQKLVNNPTDKKHQGAIDEAKQELTKLLDILKTQEREFYRIFNINNSQSCAQKLKQIQQKIDQWQQTQAGKLLDKKFLQDIFYNQIKSDIDEAQVTVALEKILSNWEPSEEWKKQKKDGNISLGEVLNDFFNLNDKTTGKKKFSKTVGLSKRYVIKQKDDKTWELDTSKEANMPSFDKLARYVNDCVNLDGVTISTTRLTHTQIQDIVYNALFDSLNMTESGSEVAKAIAYEMDLRSDLYNICTNEFVFIGWAAEIYWNAFFNFTLGRFHSYPVGDKKNLDGKSLSVDTLLKNVGFQIKSWHSKEFEDNNTHTQNSITRRMDTFIQKNLGLSGDIAKTLLRMFGSYSYNKPNEAYANTEGYADYARKYHEAYNFIEQKQYTELQTFLSNYLEHLFRIDVGSEITQELQDELGVETSKLYATFWLINDKIYPSSQIISNMIKKLHKSDTPSVLSFQIANIQDKGNSEQVWPPKRKSDLSSMTSENGVSLARRVAITYSQTIDLKLLLEEISRISS